MAQFEIGKKIDSNDNLEEAIEIITAKTLDSPYRTLKTPRIISDCIKSLYREQGIISNNMSDWDNNIIDGYKPSVDDLKALKRNIGGCFSNLSTDVQDLHPDFHRKLNKLFKNNFEEMQNFVEDFGNVSKAFTPSSNVKLNTELSYIIDTLKLPENEHIDRTEKVDIVRFQMEKMILDTIDQTIIKEIKRDPDKSLAAYFEKPDLKAFAAAINNGEPLKDGERLKELVDRAADYTMPENERFTDPRGIANYLRSHSQIIPDEPGKLSALLLTANNAPITYKPIEEMSLPEIAKIANHPLCSTLVLVSNGDVPEVTIKEFESHVKKVGGAAMDTIICKKTDDELTVESLMYKKHDGPPFRFNKTERLDIKEMSTFTDAEAKIIQTYHFNQLKKTNLSKPESLKECIYHMEQSGKFLNHQEINLISFDSKGKALNIRNLGSGTVGGTCSNPKIVFDELLKKEVAEVKVFHNHTSGASDSQTNDVLHHRELKRMGELLNKTIDSYIVSRSGVHDVETGNVYNYQKKDLIKYKQKTAKTKEKVPVI